MPNLVPVSSFDDVPELQTNQPALAGPNGPLNLAAQALANRTQWLKDNMGSGNGSADLTPLQDAISKESSDRSQAVANVQSSVDTYKSSMASTDVAKGAALVGYNGGTLKAYLDGLAAVSGMAPSAVNTAISAALANYVGGPSVMNFHVSGDGSDYLPAVTRAFSSGLPAIFPAGVFALSAQPSMVNGMVIVGAAPCRSSYTGATKITCPATGGLVNPDYSSGAGSRKSITVMNVHFYGTGAGDGIHGAFGGDIIGCKFENFATGIYNNSAFLSRYLRCSFVTCSVAGLQVCDFNGGSVRDCFFAADCAKAIDMLSMPVAGTPPGPNDMLTGTGNGIPFVISGNNFNLNGDTYPNTKCVNIRGMFVFEHNYFEDFGANASNGNVHLVVKVARFDNACFRIENNIFNTHNKGSKWGIQLYGDYSANTSQARGVIAGNQIQGFGTAPIRFGKDDGTYNLVFDVQISRNYYGTSTTLIIDNQPAKYVYRPRFYATLKPNQSCAGATYATAKLSAGVVKDSAAAVVASASGDYYNVPQAGPYSIRATVVAASTAADYPAVTAALTQNGTVIRDGSCAIKYQSNPTTGMIFLEAEVDCAAGDDLALKYKGGDIVADWAITIEMKNDGLS